VRIEHVGISARRIEQVIQNAVRPVAVVQPCPTVDTPGDGPSGRDVSRKN